MALPGWALPVRAAWAALATRWRLRFDPSRYGPLPELAPTSLAVSFGDRPSRELQALARRCLTSFDLMNLDHADLLTGAPPPRVVNDRGLRELRAAGKGVLVSSMHFGPYHYVVSAVASRGFAVRAFMTGLFERRDGQAWERAGRRRGWTIEPLGAEKTRSVVHAIRRMQQGDAVVLYMDGQGGVRGARSGLHTATFEFLKIPLRMRIGPAHLARRAGVPVVLAAAWRDRLGRRSVEFSDPLPPPAGDDAETLADATRLYYAWFEERVRRRPDLWSGYLWSGLVWAETGSAPTATVADFERAQAHARELLARDHGARLRADPARAGYLELQGEWLIVEGPARRILQASPLACAVLRAALRGERVARLPRATGAAPEAVAVELARLTLAGLARIEE